MSIILILIIFVFGILIGAGIIFLGSWKKQRKSYGFSISEDGQYEKLHHQSIAGEREELQDTRQKKL